ncbi:hypothetical protein LKL54_15895, partial [Listeria monocytogenes ATCC 19115]
MEDTAFRYLNEVEFYKISHMMKEKRREREALVDEIVDKIKTYTAEQGLVGDCLLYTSDAADELDGVDLGCCRIIKKKKDIELSLLTICPYAQIIRLYVH